MTQKIKIFFLFLMKNKALQPYLHNLVVCRPTFTMEKDLEYIGFPLANAISNMRRKIITRKVCALLITSVLLKEEGATDLIGSSFLWSTSKEGHDHWANLSQKWLSYLRRSGIIE